MSNKLVEVKVGDREIGQVHHGQGLPGTLETNFPIVSRTGGYFLQAGSFGGPASLRSISMSGGDELALDPGIFWIHVGSTEQVPHLLFGGQDWADLSTDLPLLIVNDGSFGIKAEADVIVYILTVG